MAKVTNFPKTWVNVVAHLFAAAGTGAAGYAFDVVKASLSGWVVITWVIFLIGCFRIPFVFNEEGEREAEQ